jgi:signal recognition particle receptor subunit alpha
VFPALLPLTYIPSFLSRIRQLFLSLFQPYVQALVDSLSAGQSTLQTSVSGLSERGQSALRVLREKIQAENWEYVLQRCLRSCEDRAGGGRNRKNAAVQSPAGKRAEIAAANSAREIPPFYIRSTGVLMNCALLYPADTSSETEMQKLTAEEIAKNVHTLKGKMKGGSGGKGRGGRGR